MAAAGNKMRHPDTQGNTQCAWTMGLAALLFASACWPQHEPAGGRAAPLPARASAAAPAALCQPGEVRCAGEGARSLCTADAAGWTTETCAEGSLCLSGKCLSLLLERGGALDRSRFLKITREGWLNGWAVAGPDTSGPPAAPHCAPSGYITPAPENTTRSAESFVLSGYLLSSQTRRVELRAGVTGKLRLSVGPQVVIDTERDAQPRPFQDEIFANAEIRKGLNPLRAELEQAPRTQAGFWLRIRDEAGMPPNDLLFAPGDDAAVCSPWELLQIRMESIPIQDGFSVAIHPAWIGLGPRDPAEIPFRVELADGQGDTVREVTSGRIDAAAAGDAAAAVTAAVTFSKAGQYNVRVAFGPNGEARSEQPIVYRAAVHGRILRLAQGKDRVHRSGLSEGDRTSLLEHIQTLLRALSTQEPDTVWLKRHTAEAESLMTALDAGKSPYLGRTGILRRAYLSPLDGQPQPYAVYVPPSYKPGSKPFPLILSMHGLGSRPEIALRTAIGAAPQGGMRTLREARYLPSFPDLGVILAAPWGYGNAGQRHLGEDDVLRVIEQMRGAYNIDERRISITGASLGGTVTFVVPLHYPDLFSAAAPLCGYPNLTRWESIRSVPHTPWEDILIEKRYIGNYAENGLHLPLHIIHGGKDGPERSEVIADRYRALGYPHTFDVQEDLDHNVWDYGYKDGQMIAWLKARRRPAVPTHVRLRTGEYRYDRSYWIRLIGMTDELRFADIDARWIKKDKRIRVTTQNVQAFAIRLQDLTPPEDAHLVVDGQSIDLPASAATAFVVQSEDGWRLALEEPSRSGRKRPGVSGPLDDIDRHPVLVVYGTQDGAQAESNRIVAAHFASGPYATHYPVKADVDTSPDDIQSASLILIGGPSTNQVTKSLIGDLPVRFEPPAIVFRGKRYEGADVGISMVYPHPRNPAEYVVLHAGVGYKGTLASRYLPRFAPDYLIYDARITEQRGENLLGDRAVLDGGYFDSFWK